MVSDSDECNEEKNRVIYRVCWDGWHLFWVVGDYLYEEGIFDLKSEWTQAQGIWRSKIKSILGRGTSWASLAAVKGLGLFEEGRESQCELCRVEIVIWREAERSAKPSQLGGFIH